MILDSRLNRNNMWKRINSAAIFLLVCALTVSAFQNADWIKVAPVGAGFSVLMPGKPEEEVKSAPDFTLHLFSIMAEKTIYIAGYGDYAPSIKLAPDGELAANRDNFLKSLNATLVASRQINLDGHPGLEFTGESEQASLSSRVYLVVNPHPGRLLLYHIDLYRLNEGATAAHAVDLDEILTDENAIVIIEWAERLGHYPLPEDVWRISIYGDGDEPRMISVKQ